MTANIALQRRLLTGSSLIIAAVLFFGLNILSNALFQNARLDLTDSKLYTLADGTRAILDKLQEPVTLRYYVSKDQLARLPGVNSYATRVEEMLKELERAAGGNLRLQVLDPEPFSEEEDRAVAYGLQGVPLDDTGSSTFYFGLVGSNTLDKEEVIPFFNPDRAEYLEYDLAKLIYQLSTAKRPVVGVLSTIPLEGAPQNRFFQPGAASPLVILDQMRQLFEVNTLDTSVERIPDDVKVLMLVHPREFSDKTLYAIDQFVLKGGHVLAFVDPYAESAQSDNPMMGAQGPNASDLGKLLQSWGVDMPVDVVAGDLSTAKKVQFSSGTRPKVVDYPVWMDISNEHMAANDVITSNLERITVATAGVLEARKDATTTLQPLLQTSDKAAKIASARLGMFADPQDLLRGYRPEGQFTLAARITGPVKTAFPDGPPKGDDKKTATDSDAEKAKKEAPATEQLKESTEPVNIIIVADTDMLQDRFWVQVQNFLGQRIAIPSGGNGSFVISALDNLLGSNDLISLRNRSGFARPFTALRELQQQAEQQFLDKEKQLQDQLRETERNLAELQRSKSGDNSMILSSEQQAELQRFRAEKIRIRKELRDVQHELRKSIDSLESGVKFLNIGLMPLLVGITGIVVGIYRIRRKRSAVAAPGAKTQEATA
jgi:ABC-type uncharacterized transport system involved in gliding motility auxiliary subunit